MSLNREQWARLALIQWDAFLRMYISIEPATAFDLRGDPPVFIADLQRQVGERA
mgnify:CR=1 FL=1